MTPIYLDYNATAPIRPEVQMCVQEMLAFPANPSSVHMFGREAKKHLENARKVIADSISAWPNEIVFTGSGTEANAMALFGFPGRRVAASLIEHSSVLRQPVIDTAIPVLPSGIIDLSALEKLLVDGKPSLISVMLANNETGVIQPIREVSQLTKKYGGLLHCDAAQGLGKIPVDFGALGCDLMTISAHKCGGPLGAAALVVRRDLAIQPLYMGGRQELGRRAGTENIAAIAGFAKAAELFDFGQMQALRGWLDAMESDMEAAGGIIFGKDSPRLPNTSCIAMPGVSNEVQLMDFDLNGFAVSAGSACSSGRIEASHVLSAMGVSDELSRSAIRISGGWQTTEKDIQAFTSAWLAMQKRLSRRAG